jgi:membrane protein
MLNGVSARQLGSELYASIDEDNVWNGAAALGYYLTLAIFPAFIVVMALIPYLPIENVDQAIMDAVSQALPPDAAGMVEGIVTQVTSQQRGGLLSFGLLATLWAASSGMYAIMQQLNITYHVKEGRSFVRARAVALALSVAFGVLVIGAFTLVVVGGMIEDWIASQFGLPGWVVAAFALFRWVVIAAAILLGFALIYRYGPNVEQRFAFITPGSIFGLVVLVIASLAFSIYISNFADYSATYGSIGAMIILMLWLYIAGLVILIGSEVNALFEHHSPHGKVKGEKVEGERAPQPGDGEPERRGGESVGAGAALLGGLVAVAASRLQRRR